MEQAIRALRAQHARHRGRVLLAGVALLCVVALLALALVVARPLVRLGMAGPQGTAPLLPGEQVWGGYPSDLFGTVDTQDYDSAHNLETLPAIRAQLRQAHFTLMRTFIFQHDLVTHQQISDAAILAKVAALHAAGMTCMIELATANSFAFDEHVVGLLGSRCALYEFMNEPDYEGVSASQYLADWNHEIPRLRAINPHALFGGPAASGYSGNGCRKRDLLLERCFMQQFLQGVARSGVLPDFITYHQYACWQAAARQCVAAASGYQLDAQAVLGWERAYLGKLLPTGVTEWNMDPGGPSFQLDPAVITPFVRAALAAMRAGGLSFATYFDCCNYGGYGNFDLFDVGRGGTPNAAYSALRAVIATARGAGGQASAHLTLPSLRLLQADERAQRLAQRAPRGRRLSV